MKNFDIKIDEGSRVPKYQQVANRIYSLIYIEEISNGDKLPSINELSERLYLSRDTIEKAYNWLRKKGVVMAEPSKGYYVNKKKVLHQVGKILYLVNKVSPYKLEVFKTMQEALNKDYDIEFRLFFNDVHIFMDQLGTSFENYDYVVVIPLFHVPKKEHYGLPKQILERIENIPREKLIVLEKKIPDLKENYSCIYQDFEKDINLALTQAINEIKRYGKINLIYPKSYFHSYPIEVKQGFITFCKKNDLAFEVFDVSSLDSCFSAGQAYVVISENDFLEVMIRVKSKKYALGLDIGVISYNDTPIKKLFNVSVLSTDFKKMGELAARCVSERKIIQYKNDFSFIKRSSI
ncbi:GntR family transcriptional regulator [Echinicola marina]|uniref:Transcriptional regulator n=1 Tax=Echinicola vietnamensis (strain DSM 17526 / LMG 23754 / KMM 6221) TaxID=926556 RepID=L0FRX4_ECHVK|nr:MULTISPECIES: GntR family transcriptional regulator [Echinicola]AGA76684.1 transcriptional regulator [Echinicola vietnamensis DSM 17526]UCS93824.1 GntR family transcriptional regulator [Echinicola marina]